MKKLFALAAFVAVASFTAGAGYADPITAQDTASLSATVQSYVTVDIEQSSLNFGTINPSTTTTDEEPFTVDTATNLSSLTLTAVVDGLGGLSPVATFNATNTNTVSFPGGGVHNSVPGKVAITVTPTTAPDTYTGTLTVTASAGS